MDLRGRSIIYRGRCFHCCRAITPQLAAWARSQAHLATEPHSPVDPEDVIDLLTVGMRPPPKLARDVSEFLYIVRTCTSVGLWPCSDEDVHSIDTRAYLRLFRGELDTG